MQKSLMIFILTILVTLTSGCATTNNAKSEKPVAPKVRIQQLEEEVKRKDGEIQFLKDQMSQNTSEKVYVDATSATKVTSSKGTTSSSIIGPSAKGVSVLSIQKALKNAGYYAGSIDGKAGVKTKEGVKAYQRSKGLTADGVVGAKTWTSLSKYLT